MIQEANVCGLTMKTVKKINVDRKAGNLHYARSNNTLVANRLKIGKNSATTWSEREDLNLLTPQNPKPKITVPTTQSQSPSPQTE